jgi:tRNA threonylcarbamoyladenosine modification (KEOPS) complex Cgi121 subunit
LEEPGIVGIKEYDRFAAILGFKEVKLGEINTFVDEIKVKLSPAKAQVFDADRIAGSPHLFFALLNALNAIKQGRSISKTLEIEVLLYASGQRQIDKAIRIVGVRPTTSRIALLIVALDEGEAEEAVKKAGEIIPGIRNDQVLEIQTRSKFDDLMKTFGVTELELKTMIENDEDHLQTLMWLIIEHNSLLTLNH